METENKEEKVFCKKLRYITGNSEFDNIKPSILLGLIEGEDKDFISFRTARKTHRISKKRIISIEDTDEIFFGVSSDD